jgi:hypothetical protein
LAFITYASSTANACSFGKAIGEKTGIFLVVLLDNFDSGVDNPLYVFVPAMMQGIEPNQPSVFFRTVIVSE